MPSLPPEAAGPLELINHANQHSALQHESDRRQVLVSLDNARELIARAWARRNRPEKTRVERSFPQHAWSWQYTKACVAHYATRSTVLDTRTLEHIHRLRNDLYHDGKALYPDRDCIDRAKSQVAELFFLVFDCQPDVALADNYRAPHRASTNEQIAFLSEMQKLCENLWELFDVCDVSVADADDDRLLSEWGCFAAKQDTALQDLRDDLADFLETRSRLIKHGLSALPSTESRQLRKRVVELKNPH